MLHVVTLDGGDRARHLGRFEDAEQVQGGLEGTDAGTEALNALHLDDAHEVREAVLLGAHGLPVAALVGLPLAHVALGVHVGQAGHGSVRARHVGTVDDDLVAGEELERVTGSLVRAAQPAEGHVISGGVLDTVDDAVTTQAHEQVGRQLRVHAHGDVVGPQLEAGVLLEDAEVLLDLSFAAQGVERGGRDDAKAEPESAVKTNNEIVVCLSARIGDSI